MVQEQKLQNLADTLSKSGLACSPNEALKMAESIAGTDRQPKAWRGSRIQPGNRGRESGSLAVGTRSDETRGLRIRRFDDGASRTVA